jgi:very-short-patch-repair endonuclease
MNIHLEERVRAAVYAARDSAAASPHGDEAMIEDLTKAMVAEVRTAEVRGIVKVCIARKTLVDYLSIASALGMFSGGSELAQCLGRIMDEDVREKRPLSCAAVVSKNTGLPGKGFFAQARSLKLFSGESAAEERAFWEQQARALGIEPPSDGELLPHLRPSIARKLWISRKKWPVVVGDPRQDANGLAMSIVDKRSGKHGRIVHERKRVDDVAIVVMEDGAVLAIAEDGGPTAVLIGLLNAQGVFEAMSSGGASGATSGGDRFGTAGWTGRIRCWVGPESFMKGEPPERFWSGVQHQIELVPLGTDADGSLQFRAIEPDGTPVYASELARRDSKLGPNLRNGRIVLDGSFARWELITSWADAAADGQLVLRLRPHGDGVLSREGHASPMNPDAPPWGEHELQDMLWSHLDTSHANIARDVLEHGYLAFGAHERHPLGEFQWMDVVIKVDGAHNPATMKGRSMGWSGGKQTHGEEVENRTRTALEEIFKGAERVRLRTLRFEEVSQAVLDELARNRAALAGRRANNQAKVHPENPATIEHLGLRFRSYPEVHVWEALMANLEEDESVAPLAVVGTAHLDRIEADFLVFTKHKHLVIEVDGPFHQEGLDEARRRTGHLERVGFEICRVNAAAVDTRAKAEGWVKDLLERVRSGVPRVSA